MWCVSCYSHISSCVTVQCVTTGVSISGPVTNFLLLVCSTSFCSSFESGLRALVVCPHQSRTAAACIGSVLCLQQQQCQYIISAGAGGGEGEGGAVSINAPSCDSLQIWGALLTVITKYFTKLQFLAPVKLYPSIVPSPGTRPESGVGGEECFQKCSKLRPI